MKRTGKAVKGAVGILMLAVFVWLAPRFLDAGRLFEAFSQLAKQPSLLIAMTAAYALSFVLKAAAWRIYADAREPLSKHLAPFGYSLLVNHLLPVKAGDLIRAGLAAKLEKKPWDEALHTVGILRLMDISVLLLFGACGIAVLGVAWEPAAGWAAIVAGAALLPVAFGGLAIARRRGIPFAGRQWTLLRKLRGPGALYAWLLTAASWVLEGAVPFCVLIALQTPVHPLEAVWVNSMTVAGQLFHVTPGGIGTYETSMSASLAALGLDGTAAFTAAVVSHAYKFLFAFAAGFLSWLVLPIRMEEGVRWINRFRLRKVETTE